MRSPSHTYIAAVKTVKTQMTEMQSKERLNISKKTQNQNSATA